MISKTSIRLILAAAIAAGALGFAATGCELIATVDRNKIGAGGTGGDGGGTGGTPMCNPATCDALDEECVNFSCLADMTGCDDGVAVATDSPCLLTPANVCNVAGECVTVCDPAACDAMDQECLDFECNADNTACDLGTAIAEGQSCVLTTTDICNANGVCVPLGCTNETVDGEETDEDCGGTMCDGCDNGLICLVDGDCRSNSCDAGLCVPCTDGGGECDTVAGTFCDDENGDAAEHVCKPKLTNGAACDAGTYGDQQCANDHCQADDGVCCDAACTGTDCESCLAAATGLANDGTCGPVMAGIDPDGDCTQNITSNAVNGCEGNTCSGTSAACAPATGVCRAAVAGGCDVAESCGAGLGCPADVVQPAATVCRMSAGVCDAVEMCNGTANTCPGDAKLTTVCRPSTGTCDGAESCNGTGNNCPADTNFAPNTTVCRAAAGMCDAIENCTGSSNTCPGDAKLTTVCRPSTGTCDGAESCNGVADTCPADTNFAPNTTVCRAKNGNCDVAELCTGASNNCPTEAFVADNASGSPVCPNGHTCDGSGGSCPTTCAATAMGTDVDCEVSYYCSAVNACALDQTNGQNCTDDDQCSSGLCLTHNTVTQCNGGLALTTACSGNSMCLSNNCSTNCIPGLLTTGQACEFNDQCVNNDCVSNACATG